MGEFSLCPQESSSFWINDLSLTWDDKYAVESGEMLTDKHIQAVQILLTKQFPNLDGLQSPLLVQNGSFQPLESNGGYTPEGLIPRVYLALVQE